MTIGIDLRCLPSDGSPGAGIAHAAKALTNTLIITPHEGLSWVLFLPKGAVPHAEQRLLREKPANTRIVRIEHTGGAALRRALVRSPIDLLFVPSGAVPPGVRCPAVPWVHDIAIFDHPEWFAEPMFQRALTTNLFRRGVQTAQRILCVSEFTKQEIVTHFSIDPSKIFVTSEGGDKILSALQGDALRDSKQQAVQRLAARGVTRPFVLCMGTLEPRKNIPFLVDAWLRARQGFARPTDLVIAGREGWKLGPIVKALNEGQSLAYSGASRLHRIEMPTDEDRRDLLLAAEIVAVPSLYEGFGLVALEGMQAQTAVMASTAGALPEVVGPQGIALPPDDLSAWTRTMTDLMNNPDSRHRWAEQGKDYSQRMTWDQAVQVAIRVLTTAVM